MSKGWMGLALASVLAACGGGERSSPTNPGDFVPTSKQTPQEQLALQSFSDCNAFRDYYAQALSQEYLTGYWTGFMPCWGCDQAVALGAPAIAEGAQFDAAAPPAAADSPREVTDTNTQEQGVDQADIIEADPDNGLFYVIHRASSELLVIDSTPADDLRILARYPLSPEEGYPRGMYLDAQRDRLVVLMDAGVYFYAPAGGGDTTGSVAEQDASFAPRQAGSQLLYFDVSRASDPQLVNRYWTEGYIIDSRRVDKRVHLMTQYGFGYPRALSQDDSFQQLVYQDYQQALQCRARVEGCSDPQEAEIVQLASEIRLRVANAVQAAPLDQILPREAIGLDAQPQLLACEAIYRPDVDTRMGLLMITSADTDGSNTSTIGSINNAWQVYASRDNLYLLQGSSGWWFDQAQTQQTAIYRFEIGEAAAQPRGLGLVDGWVNNSYSLSEYAGHLRVATTEGRFSGERDDFALRNHLSVLRLNPNGLDEVGSVRDFAPPDETIRSARFLGDKGYVVTFLQTDPLFAFDLSNPQAPRMTGQLEIPGFSSYIHPLGEDHLLTIGRAGGEGGQGVGNSFQLQVFDVSDPAQPLQRATASPALAEQDYAFSLAEYEPLAFSFLPDRLDPASGLLAIPAQIGSPAAERSFSGFIVYQVASDQIEEYARVDHKGAQSGGSGCPDGRNEQGVDCASFAPAIYHEPLRAVISRDLTQTVVYTLSSSALKSLDATLMPRTLDELTLSP